MLKLFRRSAPVPPASAPVVSVKPLPLRSIQECNMKTAEWHAFRSLQLAEIDDMLEAREHLRDAGEFLAQIGGPRWPQSAEEIYQWCATRRALEA